MTNIPPANDELALWHWDIIKSTTIYFYVCTCDCRRPAIKIHTEKLKKKKKGFLVFVYRRDADAFWLGTTVTGAPAHHIHISPSWLLFCCIADTIYARKCQGLISITWSLAFHLPSHQFRKKKRRLWRTRPFQLLNAHTVSFIFLGKKMIHTVESKWRRRRW